MPGVLVIDGCVENLTLAFGLNLKKIQWVCPTNQQFNNCLTEASARILEYLDSKRNSTIPNWRIEIW